MWKKCKDHLFTFGFCCQSFCILFTIVCRWQWASAFLHWEGWQGDVVATQSHMLQPSRLAAVSQLRTAQREINVRHWRNGRLRSRVEPCYCQYTCIAAGLLYDFHRIVVFHWFLTTVLVQLMLSMTGQVLLVPVLQCTRYLSVGQLVVNCDALAMTSDCCFVLYVVTRVRLAPRLLMHSVLLWQLSISVILS